MATSGTVQAASSLFTVRQFIEHAARRAMRPPEKLGVEALQVAQELLFSQLSEYTNAGFPLWTRQFNLLSTPIGGPDVPTPAGTVDVLTAYWRQFMPYRGTATSTNSGDISILFAGAPNSDVTIAGPNPNAIVNFSGPTELDTVGVLLGGTAPVTTALQVLTSTDGATYTLAQTLPTAVYTPGAWTYFDLDPSVTAQYIQLRYVSTGSLAVNQILFGLANSINTQIGPLNIDDYFNLPNTLFKADRVNSAYIDRQIPVPIIKAWPTLNTGGFYNGTVTALTRRYIQDVGQLSNQLEIPSRWNEGVTARLATRIMLEISDDMMTDAGGSGGMSGYLTLMQKQQRMQLLEQQAEKAEAMMWAEERTRGPIRLLPNVRAYTA